MNNLLLLPKKVLPPPKLQLSQNLLIKVDVEVWYMCVTDSQHYW
jgi:hypothetical protein